MPRPQFSCSPVVGWAAQWLRGSYLCIPQHLFCGSFPLYPVASVPSHSQYLFLPLPLFPFGCIYWSLIFSICFLGVLPQSLLILAGCLSRQRSLFCAIRGWRKKECDMSTKSYFIISPGRLQDYVFQPLKRDDAGG